MFCLSRDMERSCLEWHFNLRWKQTETGYCLTSESSAHLYNLSCQIQDKSTERTDTECRRWLLHRDCLSPCWLACFPKVPVYITPYRRLQRTSCLPNLPPSRSLSLPERQKEKMTPRPAMIGELCVLLEGFLPRPLTSVLSQYLLSTWSRHTAPGRPLLVEDLWELLCYSERTNSWPCAKPCHGLGGQCLKTHRQNVVLCRLNTYSRKLTD